MLNSASRSRSAVGRTACDFGAASARPRQRPPTMRISVPCRRAAGDCAAARCRERACARAASRGAPVRARRAARRRGVTCAARCVWTSPLSRVCLCLLVQSETVRSPLPRGAKRRGGEHLRRRPSPPLADARAGSSAVCAAIPASGLALFRLRRPGQSTLRRVLADRRGEIGARERRDPLAELLAQRTRVRTSSIAPSVRSPSWNGPNDTRISRFTRSPRWPSTFLTSRFLPSRMAKVEPDVGCPARDRAWPRSPRSGRRRW